MRVVTVATEHFTLPDEEATLAFAGKIGRVVAGGQTLFLHGELGAGKTTFSRGLLHALGHQGKVKSPTYTLVEPYQLDGLTVYHFDLYRLRDAEELEFMGIRDYFRPDSLCLIEWPEQGMGYLPVADLDIHLTFDQQQRQLSICANTAAGATIIKAITDDEK
ncbi:MAG: tRNA (adenosine(37)-N6)-threonylcarbamoyltransferase complex ATPase subunit type 1 TsaE [Gammaproteobacteria bacterium]|nr:tRNA (adenosine(37)-N6)-threonylcarbamoyltransferase complex ATPase subunit type 1 TsaE [Gammaproteobacteria bacterium]MBU1554575.1 tRNA (adenosine(37)-N6)-threonylcarbamoyltransferase complex ATPase subunit type 1 TsaE [Gammaproteobacteria bacterium]MBU2068742.1 tRNA (adenosine(37)-N6)-threonylcarbamoyltransferase complex ATPase subunit type 1 TsaE [Gammaproteobacteria bacterium]MBU2185189.1 tRNA (adenosine(37)-N6)-threonylcarbamoyltransferase complex ATPase subunit type 1 TsaE [Gammaproteob